MATSIPHDNLARSGDAVAPVSMNDTSHPTPLDRRVELVQGTPPPSGPTPRIRLGDYRNVPFVVVLGEPGMGKTTALGIEATREGASVVRARDLLSDPAGVTGALLFVDALDEYRGRDAGQIDAVARALGNSGATRWRIACRSDAWRRVPDTHVLGRTTGAASVTVVRLLPLDEPEAMAVLQGLEGARVDDPAAFLVKARSLGGDGFVETPLALTLLARVVEAGGRWPGTRAELFETSCALLAEEHDEHHRYRGERRRPGTEILQAASQVCLLSLVCDLPTLDRFPTPVFPVPDGASSGAPVALDPGSVGIDGLVLGNLLGTALFRGDGDRFEPLHRSIAEYLAGGALIARLQPTTARPAVAFDRVLAWITGSDGQPPTALRETYGWLCTRLSMAGLRLEAQRMIDADPVSVLQGDVASLAPEDKRHLVAALGLGKDPYFLIRDLPPHALDGLADPALVSSFKAALADTTQKTHLRYFVLDILGTGRPVPAMHQTLTALVLDTEGETWVRTRAVDGALNTASERAATGRALLDALATEPPSAERDDIRLQVLAGLSDDEIDEDDIISLLANGEAGDERSIGGRLWSLSVRLERTPRPSLFDRLSDLEPRVVPAGPGHHDIADLLDHALGAAIGSEPTLATERLMRWIGTLGTGPFATVGDQVVAAVSAWLDADTTREPALLEALRSEHGDARTPQRFHELARRSPGLIALESLVAGADEAVTRHERRAHLELMVSIVRDSSLAITELDRVRGWLSERQALDLIDRIGPVRPNAWQRRHARRQGRQQRKKAVEHEIVRRSYLSHVDAIRDGRETSLLRTAVSARLAGEPEADVIERLVTRFDEEVATALLDGLDAIARRGPETVTASDMADVMAGNQQYEVIPVIAAGADVRHVRGAVSEALDLPLGTALAVLVVADQSGSDRQSEAIERLAAERVVRSEEGRTALLVLWSRTLESEKFQGPLPGSKILSRGANEDLAEKLAPLLYDLLVDDRIASVQGLSGALVLAAKTINRTDLLALAERALDDRTVDDGVWRVWAELAFVLDPQAQQRHLEGVVDKWLLANVLDPYYSGTPGRALACHDPGARHRVVFECTARLIGPEPPENLDGSVTAEYRLNRAADVALRALEHDRSADTGRAFNRWLQEPAFALWHPSLRHRKVRRADLIRDAQRRPPAPAALCSALVGGAPINASDLMAIVRQELDRLRAELRTADTSPWLAFWNTDSNGNPGSPKVENVCRDRLLERLRDRLHGFGIAAALPEAQRADATRADVLVLSAVGTNVPIEVKRNNHKAVWTAPATQLAGYAADVGASGRGLYVVFWFGNELDKWPLHPVRHAHPPDARTMERWIDQDLPDGLSVRVFDVALRAVDPPPESTKG